MQSPAALTIVVTGGSCEPSTGAAVQLCWAGSGLQLPSIPHTDITTTSGPGPAPVHWKESMVGETITTFSPGYDGTEFKKNSRLLTRKL